REIQFDFSKSNPKIAKSNTVPRIYPIATSAKDRSIAPTPTMSAYTRYKTGAKKTNVNSSGSVTFPRNAVKTMVTNIDFTYALFSLYSVLDIARAIAGYKNMTSSICCRAINLVSFSIMLQYSLCGPWLNKMSVIAGTTPTYVSPSMTYVPPASVNRSKAFQTW